VCESTTEILAGSRVTMLSQIGVGQQPSMPQALKPCTAITLVVGMIRSSGGPGCLLLACPALHAGTANSKRTSSRMRRARMWEERGGEGARDGADACEDRWVCTRKWRDPQLDDSGRLGSKPVQCRGASEMTRSRQTFFSGFQGLPACHLQMFGPGS
jgi:hypothetical protein